MARIWRSRSATAVSPQVRSSCDVSTNGGPAPGAIDAAARDAAFDDLLQQIGAALQADPTLGGLAFGLTYGRPEPSIEAVARAPAIKTATLTVTVDYESDTPLA